MRVLMLPKYDATGASSRLRSYQYVRTLTARGFTLDVHPLLDNGYVADLYQRRISPAKVVSSYLRRLRKLVSSNKYDVVWLEKELLPWIPDWLEARLAKRVAALVVDYDDAIFHRYDRHRSGIVRAIYGRKIDAVMRRADLVTAGNDYLLSRARSAGAKRVEWLPTVVDLERYPHPVPRDHGGQLVIGWIGSPSTAHYLREVDPVIQEISRRYQTRCIAIGARSDQLAGSCFEPVAWSEAGEAAMLAQIDIGIMPLRNEPWELGKCGYKLIQYMAAGRAVVASPVGANRSIVEPGISGYLAATNEEWLSALDSLIKDPSKRVAMGMEGRRRVEELYSLQVQSQRLASLLLSVGALEKHAR